MLRTKAILSLALFVIIIAIGCSSNQSNPISPSDTENEFDLSMIIPEVDIMDTNRSLLGMWSMTIDPDNLTASVIPYRNICKHYNVTNS